MVCHQGFIAGFLTSFLVEAAVAYDFTPETTVGIIIIRYIYHALINTLSAHMKHINLNMIFYTHVEHSPTKTVYIKYYTHTHTHTHTHTNALHTHTMTVAVSEEDLADSHGTQASADTILDFLEEA